MGHSIPSHFFSPPFSPMVPNIWSNPPEKTMVDTSARATAAAITVASQVLATVKSAKRSSAVLWVSWSMCQDWFGGKVLRKIIGLSGVAWCFLQASELWCLQIDAGITNERVSIRPQRKEEQPWVGVNPCYRSVVTTSCQNQGFLPSCKR